MHPLRLWLMVVAIWLASVSLAAAASLDTAVARYTATSDGQAAYVQAVAAHFGAVDNSASKASSGAADDDGAGRARVERLLRPLAQAAQLEPPLIVVTARDDANTYALPGLIVVHRGLLTLVTDDGALSVLLAPALGHLALDPPVRGIRPSQRALYFTRRAARANTLGEGAQALVQAALHADLGLHEERAADAWAAALLPRAGITPATAVAIWTHLEAAGIPDDTYTHPSYAERKKLYGHALSEP